ncbi:MAG: DNA-processing protein DprA [Alphaproteobacteria bacterium]|nr:DNA-processing protein DprA [Alphaproteobacteria bacterium]MCY4319671.1 DNA-processing protein DprA [Alphaproteobacteria bacterium]
MDRLEVLPVWFSDDDYPEVLSRIADPPPFLTKLGDLALAAAPVIAMVGAHNVSTAGQRIVERLRGWPTTKAARWGLCPARRWTHAMPAVTT